MTQQEALQLFEGKTLTHYKKSGIYDFTIHKGDSISIDTVINGVKETSNTANEGDYILTGGAGEQYVIKPATFTKRYTLQDGKAVATGECWGFQYHGEPISFIATWNEEMICHEGDMLVSPNPELSEIYRIEKDAFAKTYQPA